MHSRASRAMRKATHVPFPAPANTSNGRSAIAALGAMLATDWASTSGRDSVPRLRSGDSLVPAVSAVTPRSAAPSAFPAISLLLIVAASYSPPLVIRRHECHRSHVRGCGRLPGTEGAGVSGLVAVLLGRYVEGGVAVEEAVGPELE